MDDSELDRRRAEHLRNPGSAIGQTDAGAVDWDRASGGTVATRVKALGEVALRVNDLDRSRRFYQEVIGLEPMKQFEHAVFFRIADGYAGHTTVLALFDREIAVAQAATTIDHVAFTIALDDYAAEKRRLEQLGFTVKTATHEWVRWRSLYVRDPDDNEVELVCYDPGAAAQGSGAPPDKPLRDSLTFTLRLRSVRAALQGIATMLRSQQNAWIHALATVSVSALGVALGLSAAEWCWIVLAIMAVWTAEALNTAFEFLADVASPTFHPVAGKAKDVAAGAVLISAVAAIVIGLLVFGPRLSQRLFGQAV